jgi:acyl-CoA thioester hydrolase
MNGLYRKSFVVPREAIDAYGHVNNIVYVQWMLEVAMDHCTSVGWPVERSLELGVAWVVRSHFIEYLRPAFEGQAITIHTWLEAMGERCPRHFVFVRDDGRKLLVRAETLFVSVDPAKGRPMAIPEVILASFPVLPDAVAVMAELGL